MALNDIAFEGTISITLKKISIWKHPLVKEVQGRSKLILNYDVNISEKEKIIKFLETYWHPIPESFRYLKEGKIRDHLKL